MITHFQQKEIDRSIPDGKWSISFFHNKKRCTGYYYKNGDITWVNAPDDHEEDIKAIVHDLMLYHVYEDHDPNH